MAGEAGLGAQEDGRPVLAAGSGATQPLGTMAKGSCKQVPSQAPSQPQVAWPAPRPGPPCGHWHLPCLMSLMGPLPWGVGAPREHWPWGCLLIKALAVPLSPPSPPSVPASPRPATVCPLRCALGEPLLQGGPPSPFRAPTRTRLLKRCPRACPAAQVQPGRWVRHHGDIRRPF